MTDALHLIGTREPLGLWTQRRPASPAHPDLRIERLEYSSRGDRVTATLWHPADSQRDASLALLQPCPVAPVAENTLESTRARLIEAGMAVLSVDLPLHGSRTDHKLAAMLNEGLRPDATAAALWLATEFACQAVADFERSLDAACSLDSIDPNCIGFIGVGLGALVGTAFSALDARVKATALIDTGAHISPPEIDPARYLPRLASRPTLISNMEPSTRVSRSAAESLHQMAPECATKRFEPDSDAAALENALRFLLSALDRHG